MRLAICVLFFECMVPQIDALLFNFSLDWLFSEIQLVCDGRTDRATHGRTDTPYYKDSRTHLERTGPMEFRHQVRSGILLDRKLVSLCLCLSLFGPYFYGWFPTQA